MIGTCSYLKTLELGDSFENHVIVILDLNPGIKILRFENLGII